VFPASKNKLITVIIPPRASSAAAGKILYEHGLVRAPLVFQVYSRLKGVDGKLKTGRYYFSLKQGVPEITAQLVKGPDAVVFTIPEGFITSPSRVTTGNRAFERATSFAFS